jgi:mRNA interferase MazF
VRRGDVVELRLLKGEQRGRRFGVIVQSDALLPRSVVLVAPTSTAARNATVRPVIEIFGSQTKVLVEQLSALDVSRFGDAVVTLDGDAMWAIDDALELVLGLN